MWLPTGGVLVTVGAVVEDGGVAEPRLSSFASDKKSYPCIHLLAGFRPTVLLLGCYRRFQSRGLSGPLISLPNSALVVLPSWGLAGSRLPSPQLACEFEKQQLDERPGSFSSL